MTNVSKITVNGNDYDIKDTEARSGLSNKQDTLVSGTNIKTINGNSLLGSGDLTVGGSVDIDRETITENGDNELQVVAVKNKRDDSTLPIWHGTEYQWNHGDPTTWHYWQTSATGQWVNGGELPHSYTWASVVYGDGRFVLVGNTSPAYYSDDGGITWSQGGNLNKYPGCFIYGNGRFVTITVDKKTYYSDDGGITWSQGNTITSSSYFYNNKGGIFYNGYFMTIDDDGNVWVSQNGETWNIRGATNKTGGYWNMAQGNGVLVAVRTDTVVYSTDGGVTWNDRTLSKSCSNPYIAFGNGIFVIASRSNGYSFYSSDGITWNFIQLPITGNITNMVFGNGFFLTMGYYQSQKSPDGINWTTDTISNPGDHNVLAYGSNKFITVNRDATSTSIFSVTYDKCYTDTASPTTTSVVYSAPETVSSYTISSVASGAITLSDNNTYYYNQSGNVFTYRTIGDAHPEYLCFIDGVGIKKGNTLIASATPITTTITSTSIDTEAPSAKAVYDEIGEVESALNTINSGS